MKKYIVTFKNKKTGADITEVVVSANEEDVEQRKTSLTLKAIEKLKVLSKPIPRNATASYRLFK